MGGSWLPPDFDLTAFKVLCIVIGGPAEFTINYPALTGAGLLGFVLLCRKCLRRQERHP